MLIFRYSNAKEEGSKVFKFTELKDTGVLLVHQPFFGSAQELLVTFDKLKGWKVHKGVEPTLCDPSVAQQLLV